MLMSKEDPYSDKRHRMVQEQIAGRGVADKQVLAAMSKVKRHLFVPESARPSAYNDHPLGIGYEQTISQPYIVGYMTEALKLNNNDKVLEIGIGSGYQAAVLAEIVKEVYSIEVVKELAELTQKRIEALGYRNIHIKYGDGFDGWEEHAPYDAIMVTAAPEEVPPRLLEQLAVGGRMVVPMGLIHQELYLFKKTEKGIEKKRLLPVRFVPMIKGNIN